MYVLRMKVIVRVTQSQQCIAALSKLFGPLWASAAYLRLPNIPWAPLRVWADLSWLFPVLFHWKQKVKGNQVFPTSSFCTSLFHTDNGGLAEIRRKKGEMWSLPPCFSQDNPSNWQHLWFPDRNLFPSSSPGGIIHDNCMCQNDASSHLHFTWT